MLREPVRKLRERRGRMTAIVLTEQGRLERVERPVPDAPPEFGPRFYAGGEALIRVDAVGVCGSDLPRAFGGKAYHYPLVLGHEFAGTVERIRTGEAGSTSGAPHGATSAHEATSAPAPELREGDRVAVFPLLPRPGDPMSEVGEYALSSGYDYFGSRRDGAFQEYLWVPLENLVAVPTRVATQHAALTEPAAVALHAVRKLAAEPGGSALVIGGGPIGTLAAQWLRIHGVEELRVAEVDERKLAILAELGLETVDAAREDVVEAVWERSSGQGADWVVEAAGTPGTVVEALRSAGTGGRVVLMGNVVGDTRIPEKVLSELLRREISVVGTWNSRMVPRGRSEWDTVLAHMDAELRMAPIVSHVEPLSRAPELLADMHERRIWFNRVVLTPGPTDSGT
jgi:L-iditol 2-dehydrogenase/galactitol-1-phosphate 5-dehydrogenase